jgi:GNAT superfamily N-acetyltransferase
LNAWAARSCSNLCSNTADFADVREWGGARVVTDEATFAWIFDVFVDEHNRGRGLGTWLVESIVEDLSVLNVGLVYVPATSFTAWKVCRSLPNSGIRPRAARPRSAGDMNQRPQLVTPKRTMVPMFAHRVLSVHDP